MAPTIFMMELRILFCYITTNAWHGKMVKILSFFLSHLYLLPSFLPSLLPVCLVIIPLPLLSSFILKQFPHPNLSFIYLLPSFLKCAFLIILILHTIIIPLPIHQQWQRAVWSFPHILATVCWVFPKCERKWILFIHEHFNCFLLTKMNKFLTQDILCCILIPSFWRWFLDL